MFPICQHFYTLGVEVYFTRIGDFTWRVVWLWRISGGGQSHNWVCDWPFLDCWFWMDISV